MDTKNKRITGQVVSDAMQKTIVVEQTRLCKHPRYGKYIKRKTTVFADDPDNKAAKGDTVIIEHCRPLSKRKSWRLVELVSSAN